MRIVRYFDGNTRYGLLAEDDRILPLAASPFESLATAGAAISLKQVRLLAPVVPGAIYCGGLNYVQHAKEVNLPLPERPMFFMKPPGAVIGSGEAIIYPKQGQNVHHEGELVAVIGKQARRVSVEEALSYVLGYTIGNDVSERVIQFGEMKNGTLVLGKGFDTFCPLGPCIATGLDPNNLELTTRVNGEIKQQSNTSDMIFSVAQTISYLSSAITLYPGDVVMTGTPAGVGPIKPGDVVEVEISGIGVLSNPVVAER